MMFDAAATDLEDGADAEPDLDDEDDCPPVVIDIVRPKTVERRRVRAFGQVD